MPPERLIPPLSRGSTSTAHRRLRLPALRLQLSTSLCLRPQASTNSASSLITVIHAWLRAIRSRSTLPTPPLLPSPPASPGPQSLPSTDPDNTASQISYDVYRNGSKIASTAADTTSYSDTGLAKSTSYSYNVAAYDAAGNTSAHSASVSVFTQATASTIAIGDRVVTTAKLNVRQTAGGTILGTQAILAQGTVIAGPTKASGYTWWRITYDTAPSGWSIANYLAPQDTTSPALGMAPITHTLALGLQGEVSALQFLLQKVDDFTGEVTGYNLGVVGPQTRALLVQMGH
jgi:chitodextrinase